MTDRELLELAAIAAGIKGVYAEIIGHPSTQKAILRTTNGQTWNPLQDDREALRLAVKLGISIEFCFISQQVCVEDCCELVDDDPYSATRLAIVRAAAEIAKAQESNK